MDYEQWKNIHRQQLESVPERFWQALFRKLCTEQFDAGEYFIMSPSSSTGWSVRIKERNGVAMNDSNSVFLIDHAWTYLPETCHQQLCTIPGLALRMANLMDLIERPTTPTDNAGEESEEEEVNGVNGTQEVEEEEEEEDAETDTDVPDEITPQTSQEGEVELPSANLVEKVLTNMWRYNDWYTVSNVPVPVWYVMEEFGSRIQHSDTPTVAIVPFFHILSQMSYSVLWPLRDLQYGDMLTRNRVQVSVDSELTHMCNSLPFITPGALPLSDPLWSQLNSLPIPPMPDGIREQLPDVISSPPTLVPPLKVYSEIELVKKHLTHPFFKLVSSEEEADILWYFEGCKDYRSLLPNQFVNQFPSENVLTCKDLMISVAKRTKDGIQSPDWIPESYNLFYELPRFVHKFKSNETRNEENIWIIKPWNLGRSMDIYITTNLFHVIRLSQASPKVASKYISNPVLFYREDVGNVKMDIRYIVLLVSVKPLVVYTYNVFWLRFANKPFVLDSFHDYEIHFTVMNYRENVSLKHIESVDFIPMFEQQYSTHSWDDIQRDIHHSIYELFVAATSEEPPAGIRHYPQSRAMYAIDLMLEWTPPTSGCDCQDMQPKLLEVNFCPDCNRACQYHPTFINDVFECLFVPESQHNPNLPVTKLAGK